MKNAVIGTVLTLLTLLCLHFSVVSVLKINGSDLAPAYQEGDYALISRMAYSNLTRGRPSRGDGIWAKDPETGQHFFARLLALPGEWVEPPLGQRKHQERLYVKEGQCFTNKGLFPLRSIKGKVIKNLSH